VGIYYPHDPHLRLWSGLVLERQGDAQKALEEYTAAIELGIAHWRAHWYLARVAEKLNQHSMAHSSAQYVVRLAPDFPMVREFLLRIRD